MKTGWYCIFLLLFLTGCYAEKGVSEEAIGRLTQPYRQKKLQDYYQDYYLGYPFYYTQEEIEKCLSNSGMLDRKEKPLDRELFDLIDELHFCIFRRSSEELYDFLRSHSDGKLYEEIKKTAKDVMMKKFERFFFWSYWALLEQASLGEKVDFKISIDYSVGKEKSSSFVVRVSAFYDIREWYNEIAPEQERPALYVFFERRGKKWKIIRLDESDIGI